MKIAVIGAGLMGRAIAWDMIRSEGVEQVLLLDADAETLEEGAEFAGDVVARIADAGDAGKMAAELEGYDAAVSCVPYFFNENLTRVCIEKGVHFCDLGGNNDVVDAQFALNDEAEKAGVTIVPDCGLAPGMASVWTWAAVEALDECESVAIRCGGLPVDPQPPFNYMKLFSINGLLNEYVEPCRIIADGDVAIVDGMSGLERLSFPQPFDDMEAFYTSGGSSTLVRTLHGRVRNLDYKTVRYPGHAVLIRAMMAVGLVSSDPVVIDGKAVAPRRMLENLLERYLPSGGNDVTLLRCEAQGMLDGAPATVSYELVDFTDSANGISSMMRCTGFPAAAVARMMADGTIRQHGARPQELVVPADRLAEELAARGVEVEKKIVRQ